MGSVDGSKVGGVVSPVGDTLGILDENAVSVLDRLFVGWTVAIVAPKLGFTVGLTDELSSDGGMY